MQYAPFRADDLAAVRWLPVPHPTREFHLTSQDSLLATLTWEREHGSLARGETADARWTFKRVGYLPPHISVRRPGEPKDLARLRSQVHVNWVDHWIEIALTPRYDLKRTSHLVPSWRLLKSTGEEVAHIEAVRDGSALAGGLVAVSPSAVALPELPLLLLLSWYFVALSWPEDEVVGAWTDRAEGRF